MVFDKNNLLYIVDSKLKQVIVLDTDGNYLKSIGEDQFIYPTAINYDKQNDRLFISEHGGINGGYFGFPDAFVWIYDTKGNYLGTLGTGGTSDGEFLKIQGTAINKTGSVYVIDQSLSSISIFEEDKTYLNEFGEYGNIPGKLHFPMDIKIDAQGRAIVTSMSSGTIEAYYINEINPTYEISATKEHLCPGENTDIKVDFTGNPPWSFTYTLNGSNPTTITNTYDDPYVFNISDTGLYEVISMSDSLFGAVDYSSKVRVIENPLPTANIVTNDSTLCIGESMNIQINLTGVAPWNLAYTDGSIAHSVPNIQSSPYFLNVNKTGVFELTNLTSDGSCTAVELTGSTSVFVNPLSAVISPVDTTVCEGQMVEIPISFTGTAPFTFTYSLNGLDINTITTSDNPYILQTSEAGEYAISTLSDASNTSSCMNGSPIINNFVLPTASISSGNASFCEGESTDIVIELTGNAPWNLNYSFNNNPPTLVTGINESPYLVNVQDSGVFVVESINDSNCDGLILIDSAIISINPLPTSNLESGNTIYTIFNGSTFNYQVNLTGTSPWTFDYTYNGMDPVTVNTDTNIYVLPLSEQGTYEITALSDAFCSSSNPNGSVSIYYDVSPTAHITSIDTDICEGETTDITIELTGTPPWIVTYTNNGIDPDTIITDTSFVSIPVSQAGLYEVAALSDANKSGIYMVGSTNVNVNPNPIIDLGEDVSICEGASLTLDAGTHSTYLWDNGSTNQTRVVNATGLYSVTVTNEFGCESLDEIFVTSNPLPIVDLGIDQTICQGESIQLDAGNFASYLWNDGSTGQTIEVNSTGTYAVSVTDQNGCSNSDNVFINVLALPVSDFTFTSDQLSVIFTNQSLNANSYLWEFGDSNTSTEENPVYIYAEPGSYEVNLIASNAECGDSSITKTVVVDVIPLNNITSDNTLDIYPNPSNGFITIRFNEIILGATKIILRNISGKIVFEKTIKSPLSKQPVDITEVPVGIYTLSIIANDKTQNRRIVISK
ncbi:MAG: hypothetical protein C0599_12195 [Salinivirgaceae bacterium]|nr:MAG: hypothetical protein C0599_12195 [Salinivirgaceae bacterium]